MLREYHTSLRIFSIYSKNRGVPRHSATQIRRGIKARSGVKVAEAAAAEANAQKDKMAQEVALMKRLLEARNREQEVADAEIADMR